MYSSNDSRVAPFAGQVDETGFTIIELMVVVGIVGILAALASSAYHRFEMRARNAEAKIGLSALYAAEVSFAAESGSFTACLEDIGFAPQGDKRIFRIGFNSGAATANLCGSDGVRPCTTVGWTPANPGGRACKVNSLMDPGEPYAYSANVLAPGASALPGDGQMPPVLMGKNTFTASAASGSSWTVARAPADPRVEAIQLLYASLDRVISSAQASVGPPVVCSDPTYAFTINENKRLQSVKVPDPNCAL